MGVTFNLVDQGTTRTGVYCHITDVAGPKKHSTIADGTDGHWYATGVANTAADIDIADARA